MIQLAEKVQYLKKDQAYVVKKTKLFNYKKIISAEKKRYVVVCLKFAVSIEFDAFFQLCQQIVMIYDCLVPADSLPRNLKDFTVSFGAKVI